MFSDENGGLSFGGALVAVIVGGWFSSLFSPLMSGFTPFLGSLATGYGWIIVGAAFGGFGVRLALTLFGYDIPYVAAAGALFLGNLVGLELPRLVFASAGPMYGPFVGGFGLFFSLPGLLLSAFIIQACAGDRPRRRERAA